ncbi:hypothetical protein DV872_01640 [Oceanispirochaeta sp. M1]|nr:hypothetical protein DV872_01640 [Oceanispirochaeta sp. M1]
MSSLADNPSGPGRTRTLSFTAQKAEIDAACQSCLHVLIKYILWFLINIKMILLLGFHTISDYH